MKKSILILSIIFLLLSSCSIINKEKIDESIANEKSKSEDNQMLELDKLKKENQLLKEENEKLKKWGENNELLEKWGENNELLEKSSDIVSNENDNKTFTISQINSIAEKIESIEKAIYDKNDLLIKWNFKAEYLLSKDYKKDTDKIIVNIDDKKYEINWVHSALERKKYLIEIAKWWCKWDKDILLSPSSVECIMSKEFKKFEDFSPSWYYILYSIWWYENYSSKLVDVKTWNVVLDINWWVTINAWTKDKSRFIYWQTGWIWNKWWLYITIEWDFPKIKKINDYDILAWYVDDNYIYVKAEVLENNSSIKKLFIYDLKDLSLVYSK